VSIGLIAIGRVEKELLSMLQSGLSKAFHCPVFCSMTMPEPVYAFDQRRNQYLSTAILRVLREQPKTPGDERMLGVVDHDLYVPELNFVFGQASGTVAVIALTRLRPGFYGLPDAPRLFQQRVLTEAVHELGHTYGLPHCVNSHCVMFFSNTLHDTDRKSSAFCPQCQESFP
jgi:archaemetzincin